MKTHSIPQKLCVLFLVIPMLITGMPISDVFASTESVQAMSLVSKKEILNQTLAMMLPRNFEEEFKGLFGGDTEFDQHATRLFQVLNRRSEFTKVSGDTADLPLKDRLAKELQSLDEIVHAELGHAFTRLYSARSADGFRPLPDMGYPLYQNYFLIFWKHHFKEKVPLETVEDIARIKKYLLDTVLFHFLTTLAREIQATQDQPHQKNLEKLQWLLEALQTGEGASGQIFAKDAVHLLFLSIDLPNARPSAGPTREGDYYLYFLRFANRVLSEEQQVRFRKGLVGIVSQHLRSEVFRGEGWNQKTGEFHWKEVEHTQEVNSDVDHALLLDGLVGSLEQYEKFRDNLDAIERKEAIQEILSGITAAPRIFLDPETLREFVINRIPLMSASIHGSSPERIYFEERLERYLAFMKKYGHELRLEMERFHPSLVSYSPLQFVTSFSSYSIAARSFAAMIGFEGGANVSLEDAWYASNRSLLKDWREWGEVTEGDSDLMKLEGRPSHNTPYALALFDETMDQFDVFNREHGQDQRELTPFEEKTFLEKIMAMFKFLLADRIRRAIFRHVTNPPEIEGGLFSKEVFSAKEAASFIDFLIHVLQTTPFLYHESRNSGSGASSPVDTAPFFQRLQQLRDLSDIEPTSKAKGWQDMFRWIRNIKEGTLRMGIGVARKRIGNTLIVYFEQFFFKQLELLALRLWDDGTEHARKNSLKLQGLLRKLNYSSQSSGHVVVRDALYLPTIGASMPTEDGPTEPFSASAQSYFEAAIKTSETFSWEERVKISIGRVGIISHHLRAVTYMYEENYNASSRTNLLQQVRGQNDIDYPLLLDDLTTLLEAYDAIGEDDPEQKERLAEQILYGIAADAPLMTNSQMLAQFLFTYFQPIMKATSSEEFSPIGRYFAERYHQYFELLERHAPVLFRTFKEYNPRHFDFSPFHGFYSYASDHAIKRADDYIFFSTEAGRHFPLELSWFAIKKYEGEGRPWETVWDGVVNDGGDADERQERLDKYRKKGEQHYDEAIDYFGRFVEGAFPIFRFNRTSTDVIVLHSA